MATTVGTIQLLATIDTSRYKQGAKEIEKTNDRVEKSGDETSSSLNKGFSNVAKVGLAAVAAAAVAAGAAITRNIGDAVRRVDTLNNANRTFENMGFQTQQVDQAMEDLVTSVTGLPTPLDSAVRGMQSLAATYGDVGQGQRIFTALNNAILGFGGTAAEVDNAIQQISQLPMDGPLDAQTWNSLRNSGLTPVLVAMSKEMGLSINDMKEDFGEGELTVRDFTETLARMDKEGGGGLKSLEQIARDATSGIGTGWANMQTAITKGVAEIIESIGSENISNAISSIGKAFQSSLSDIAGFFEFLIRNQNVFIPIAVGIGTIISLLTAWFVATKTFTAAQAVLNTVLAANPIGLIIIAVAGLVASILWLWNNVKGFRDFWIQTWDTITSIASGVWEGIVDGWNTVKDTVLGAIDSIKNTAESVFNSITEWVEDNRKAIENVAIVIGTILLPSILRIGIRFGVAAAQAVASFAVMSASAIASAATTSFVWVTQTLPSLIAGFVRASASAVLNALKISASFVAASARTLVSWSITFARMVAGFVLMGVQALLAGARMAAGMLLALGPIGLVIAAVVGAAALIVNNWDTVRGAFVSVWNWVKTNWPLLLAILTGPIGLAVLFIIRNFDKIRDVARNVFNWIKGIFSTIGDVASGIFRGAVNAVLGTAENIINGFIRAINNVVGIINRIPGVNIGNIGELNIPRLANGGIVTSPTLAEIGEGGEAEAVIPLSKLDQMLGNDNTGVGNGRNPTIQQTNNVYTELDMNIVNRRLTWELNRA